MQDCSPPSINDLLADPLIALVMRADRVEPADVRALLGRVASGRRKSLAPRSGWRAAPWLKMPGLSSGGEACCGC